VSSLPEKRLEMDGGALDSRRPVTFADLAAAAGNPSASLN
jgi:hypothetical protein